MFRIIKNLLIPHQGNNYEPHLLRVWPIALLLFVTVAFFGAVQVLDRSLSHAGSSLAAVVASVLVDLTNFDRAAEGQHTLSVNPILAQAAQLKANDMAAKGYFAHNAPDGKTPWYWFGEAGYEFSYAGENLAVFFGDSEGVERAWMNSPAHRANILSSNFTEIGIATAEGYYQGQKTVFVVQMFGTPSVTRPVATLQIEPTDTSVETEGVVSGESIQVITEEELEPTPPAETLKVIHQDETFIAVRDSEKVSAPSAGAPEVQSTMWERMIASPYTLLGYIYSVLGGLVALALVFLMFLEMHIQKPKNIMLGLALLLLIGTLFYFSYTGTAIAVTGI